MSTVTHSPDASRPADSAALGRPPHRGRRERALVHRAIALAACLGLGVTGCGSDDSSSSSSSETSSSQSSSATAGTGAGKANTAEVVTAAEAFLKTLSDDQKDTALYDFDDEAKAKGWSNFPTSFVERNGIEFADLDDDQKAAALKVMEAALSDQGYEELEEIRIADAYLGEVGSSGSGGGPGGGDDYSADKYFLALFGEPSETEQFMVQFGGHHAAYNITYFEDDVSLSPTLTAIEPSEFETGGTSYAPLQDKRDTTIAAIGSLGDSELEKAEIDGSFDDLLLGPGNDGPFPDPEGVVVGDLTDKQQAKVTAMIRTWVDDLDEEAAEALVARYVSEYDETYLGWSGATSIDDKETYVRVDGPSVWIEFSNQGGIVVEGVHQHTIFRDQTADYGWN
ncbi:DUF3500 domain-containing protein [Streptomyces akebiae]|uniref:DUF3500 domain-containing protein n=1 Tax=Streptomyces akebiae TaxID=2865673 RepID=A0ABX8XJL8_9ACTN|nr:DUF3500 domain-containing protein [Streptomyces akebiae]QYX76061.1 DUF3500 domain-containing protein [Streptomyces akebiae]